MSWRYTDYVKINQDFIDVFSAEQDQQNVEAWMSFIPHDQMLSLLRELLDSLERKTPQSLWMHGQFGTGKTMCLFVLKHLLEDSWVNVEKYFDAHNLGADLRQRLRGIRERGQGLVVYLSGSGHIDTNLKLMASLERVIQQGIEHAGGKTVVGPLYEAALAKIRNAGINWAALYAEHRGDFIGLATSAQDVIDQLLAQSTSMQPRLELLQKVVHCLQSASVVILDSAERMKNWIDEVITVNSLSWIVVMYDEFTEFFLHNAGLDGLQELAQFTAKSPFYFLLATHKAPDVLRSGRTDDWRKIRDRFKTVPYLMESVTTNKLIGRVFQVNPRATEEWTLLRTNLWENVRPFVGRLIDVGGRQSLRDYAEVVPLHPYSAYLLSSISQQFSSANRTVFKFMKAPGAHGFPQFLNTHPDSGWQWYTAEGLWDYFFGAVDPDTPREILDVINYYLGRQKGVTDVNQLRALKATMLLIGLEKAFAGEERVKPTLANLSAIFSGTPLRDNLDQVMQALTETDLIRRVGSPSGGGSQYTIPQSIIDHDRVKKIRSELPAFDKLCGREEFIGKGARSAIEGTLPERIKRRLSLFVTSLFELQQRRERIISQPKPYQISVVVVISENDDEIAASRLLLQKLSIQFPETLWIMLEDSFGASRFTQYQDDAAFVRYYTEIRDDRNVRFHQERCREIVANWIQTLRNARLISWINKHPTQVAGTAGIQEVLDRTIQGRFPYRPELILATDPLFRSGGFGTAGAEVGLGTKTSGAPYDQVIDALSVKGLCSLGLPLQEEQLSLQPEHPVTKMKLAIDEFLSQDSVSLEVLWEMLQAPPFGLPPAPISITLFGLLLRECGSGYYWSDGTTSHSLDLTRLAQLIKDTMDNKSGQTLQKSSQEERHFCSLVSEIYHLDETNTRYLIPTRDALRGYFVRMGYPLWSLTHHLVAKGRIPCGSISALSEFVSSRDVESQVTQERLWLLVAGLEKDKVLLKELNDYDSYQSGMRYFLDRLDGRVTNVLGALNLSTKDLIARLRELLEEEVWLWNEEEIATRLPGLMDELELVLALSQLVDMQAKDLNGAITAFIEWVKPGKLPTFVLAHQEDIKLADTMSSLTNAIRLKGEYTDKASLANSIRECQNDIRRAVSRPSSALRNWAQHVMTLELAEAEADQLWMELPDLSGAQRDDEIRNSVRQLIRVMERNRAITLLHESWQKQTGTSSPDAWSNKNGVPIGWLLESSELMQTIQVIQRPERATIEAVREAHLALNKLAPILNTLAGAASKDKFLDIVAGAYRLFIEDNAEFVLLKQHLANSLAKPPARWEQSETRDATITWIRSQYRNRYLARVIDTLKATPETSVKALLGELAKDPLVGIRLLALGK